MSPFRVLFLVLLLLWPLAATGAEGQGTIVILVRHAEKQVDVEDPGLTAAGRARAEELVRVLADVPVDVLLATQFRRTSETLAPLAEDRELGITIDPVSDPVESCRKLANEILDEHEGNTVVLAGHSNTVPLIIEALGAGPTPTIDHEQYDDLFVVTIVGDAASLLRLKFGE